MKFLRKGLLLLFLPPALFLIEGAGFHPVILSGAKDLAILAEGGGCGLNGVLQTSLFQLAFPYDDDKPALSLHLPPNLLVALLVPGDLGGPEVRVGLGNSIVGAAFVSMPEAAVNEDDRPVLRQDDIGGSGETFVVQTVSKAQMPKRMTQTEFRAGIVGSIV